MKRIAIACTLLLLGSFSLLAADPAVPVLPVLTAPPAVCSQGGLQGAGLTPKPTFKSVIPPPCHAATNCNDGSFLACPNVSYDANCTSSDGCWVDCGQYGFLYCPGAQSDPACAIY